MPRKYTPEERITAFWSKVDRSNGPDSCWRWQAYKSPLGYGRLTVSKQTFSAHRFSYELTYGPVPDTMCVCHRCDIRDCCNPDHLFLGTQRENVIDMFSKGRSHNRKGEKGANHKLTLLQVSQIRELYQTGNYLQRELAIEFDVDQTEISRIVRKMTWK